MLTSLGITAALIAGPVICLILALRLSARYARRVGKSTHQYTAVSLVGWLFGTIGAAVGTGVILDWLETRGLIPVARFSVPAAYGVVLVGAFAGASIGHIWLRMTTKRDPDYDDRPSVVPDVGQQRDRDDLPPHD
jgi:hypothetical protein